ncbi:MULTISPECIES: Lrp/AsnC family transcriptional regulator [unclassified Spirosoma]|uniref:Lrp/AsnC family transcriptional regulator n=1 Tax=unclassified Spirosoma TaxID=2621999 RepID=UPI00095C9E3D|nr:MULTISPECIES: Lrp/AsnC family transcriptional regulator [unclassified Spirosoma]MBN8821305.1 Lrp/AsnC family transcriptional regulator [Spirosoma sp.]OJW78094.1 MAG: hypothetical protein BGO59_29180 [Spirosoma sp. 48-14]
MKGIWVDSVILRLGRTSAETLLLARICYRAAIAKDGLCHDSNKELSAAIGIHAQSVSDLVRKLDKEGIIQATILGQRANARTIGPLPHLVTPYKENADRYKEITDSDYKEIPYSAPNPPPDLSGNSLDPIRNFLTPYKPIPYSLYKDRKPLENPFKTFLAHTAGEGSVSTPTGEQKKTDPPPRPLPKHGESFTLKSDSEKLNVPYSSWKTIYLLEGNETELRKLWMDLTDEEREKALEHTPRYMLSNELGYLKAPANYLLKKEFNIPIIKRNGNAKTHPFQPSRTSGPKIPVSAQSSGSTGKGFNRKASS